MENYISVTQVNSYIKNIFDAEIMLQNICVFGEISSYNVSGGIAYFNIKDESSILPCVLFGAGRFATPKIGDMVLVRGGMNYYMKGGRLSFNAVAIEPYGKGILYEKFLQLKAELKEQGYFATERKRALPERVKRVGVVTSATGAVIQDIIDVTMRRNDTVDIVLYPVKVQGVGAEKEIAAGIEFFSNYENVDVIIVARGGGSLEDLMPFNTEMVAIATYHSKKPVVSAVGHETDFTIIDFVADVRAATPSVAAELVAWSKQQEVVMIFEILDKMLNTINQKHKWLQNNLDSLASEIASKVEFKVLNKATVVDNLSVKITNATEVAIDRAGQVVGFQEQLLSKLNPLQLASNGYIKLRKNGKLIKSVNDVDECDEIVADMIDGSIVANVAKCVKK